MFSRLMHEEQTNNMILDGKIKLTFIKIRFIKIKIDHFYIFLYIFLSKFFEA